MTRYLKLTRDDNIQINLAFGNEVGAWTNRNDNSIMIGNELVHDAQKRLKHNRVAMANPKRWVKSVNKIVDKYHLIVHESVTEE